MTTAINEFASWFFTVDAWVTSKAPTSMFLDGAPASMRASANDLLWSFPIAIVLTIARLAANRFVFKPTARTIIPLSKRNETIERKFTESAFKFIMYLVLSIQGVTIQLREQWLLDTTEYWRGWPTVLASGVRPYYQLELALYFHLIVSQFFDTRRKDFVEMFVHHVVTILLMTASYIVHFGHIGCTIMIVHDISDVFLELAKLANYAEYKQACDALFVVFASVFFVTRLVILPFKIMYTVMIESLEYSITTIGWAWHSCFMLVLVTLHLFWFGIILKMISKFMSGDLKGDERSDDEGDSECDTKKSV